MSGYRLLEHTGDMAFRVEAPTWPALLALASAALGAVILEPRDPDGGRPGQVELEVEGADREDVLVAWLNEALLRFETEGLVPRTAVLRRADATRARGLVTGRRLDLAREAVDRVVKAATYHDLEVIEGGGAQPWRATVVLDL
ncbi:MAG: archease [Planctomycetota bacterium]